MTGKIILLATLAIASGSPAAAGDYSCNGKVTVGAEHSLIIAPRFADRPDLSPPHDCVFATNSKVGRQILKQCPDGSDCLVELPLPLHGGVPDEHVTTIKPNASVDIVRTDETCQGTQCQTETCSSDSCDDGIDTKACHPTHCHPRQTDGGRSR